MFHHISIYELYDHNEKRIATPLFPTGRRRQDARYHDGFRRHRSARPIPDQGSRDHSNRKQYSTQVTRLPHRGAC